MIEKDAKTRMNDIPENDDLEGKPWLIAEQLGKFFDPTSSKQPVIMSMYCDHVDHKDTLPIIIGIVGRVTEEQGAIILEESETAESKRFDEAA